MKAKLQDLVEAHSDVPKPAAFTYSGGQIGALLQSRKNTGKTYQTSESHMVPFCCSQFGQRAK